MADRSTIYEVAQRSGVSTATVSRVMADGKGFSPATRDRVLAIAAEIGWVPSGPARGLASRRAGIVGLLFPDLGASGERKRNRRCTWTRSSVAPNGRRQPSATRS